jgi:hypothetical protein
VPPLDLRGLAKRLRQMACLWGLFGVLVGLASLPAGADPLRVVSGILAGVLVLIPVGLFFGLFGGQPRATLFGGVSGALLGVVVGVLNNPVGAARLTAVALIAGALCGATLHLAAAWMRFLLRVVTLAGRYR